MGLRKNISEKTIKQRLSRGRVDVFLNYYATGEDTKTAMADIGLIKSYVSAARAASRVVGVADDLQLSHIIRIPEAIMVADTPEDESKQIALIDNALSPALDALTDMRAREGASLNKDIHALLGALRETTVLIERKKDSVSRDYSEKLKARLNDLLGGEHEIDETRFNTEIAYIADKSDINEEIVRLNTHISQFEKAANENNAVGRKLDFMVQEMNRELNTIGSKSQDISITNAVIEGKSIVEKIREQVQNIE